jgi:glyoxylase-like metal-dependent hydrolase (beta-lactamase superfamily II)
MAGMLLVESFPVGPLQCNCTVLACGDTKQAVIVDPGGDPEKILERVRHYDLDVRALVHTHAHLDHIAATRDLKEATGGEILLHPGDRWLYDNFAMQAAMFGWRGVRDVLPVDRELAHAMRVDFGKRAVEVLHTPGHTPGSVCFLVAAERLLVAGDTLFRRSIGRTDLWGGSFEDILASIRQRLFALSEDTRVITGHGPETTIGDEKHQNPFVGARA